MVALVTLMGLTFVSEDVLARGGSRSSSSSRSSYSKPKSTPSRTYSKPAPKKITPSKTKSSRVTAKPKMTPAKQKSLETAKKNGTAFKSKDDATAAFKKNQAGKYPAKYATKPATRPEHIPATTMVNGRSVNVVWNADRGCYGYPGSTLGAFIAYDMMSDAIMMNTMMSRNHYLVQPPVTHVQVHRTSPSLFGIIFGILSILIILAIIFFFIVPALNEN